MFCIFLLEMVGLSFFIQSWFFSGTSAYALAVSALVDKTYTKPGEATEQFINDLENDGLKPLLGQEIKRVPFSVKGVLISWSGDSVEVFEYPNHDTALNDGMMLTQKYTQSTPVNQWKNTIHLYIKDKIIIFYMGTKKNILATLDKNQEFPLSGLSVYGSRLSN